MNNNFFKGTWDFATKIWTKDISITNYKEIIRDARCYCCFFLVSVVLSAIFYTCFEKSDNELHIISNIALVWILLSFAPLIFGFVVLLSKIEKIPLTMQCNQIYNCKDAIKDVIIEKDIAHTKKFTKKLLQKYNDYIVFITEFEKATNITIVDDDLINTDSINSKGGRFRCVIANPNYYNSTDDERTAMIEYFFSNQKIAENNQYQRIFSLPTKGKENKLSAEESKTMYFYVLSNVFSGVETYVLQVDENETYDFIKNIDYVIGDVCTSELEKSNLYFSYAIDIANKKKILKTTDDCLLHLMKSDFNTRIQICHKAGSNDSCMKITGNRDREYMEFIKKIDVSLDKEKQYIEELLSWLSHSRNGGINLHKIDNNTALIKRSKQILNSWKKEVKKEIENDKRQMTNDK
jgi:hypothetical protein